MEVEKDAVIGDAIGIGTFEGIREQTFLKEVDAIDPSAGPGTVSMKKEKKR